MPYLLVPARFPRRATGPVALENALGAAFRRRDDGGGGFRTGSPFSWAKGGERMKLTDYRALSFDVCGTSIDRKSAMVAGLVR